MADNKLPNQMALPSLPGGTDPLTLRAGQQDIIRALAQFTPDVIQAIKTLQSDTTAAAILASLLTVDGAGSGLDAGLLDGQNSSVYGPPENQISAATSGLLLDSGTSATEVIVSADVMVLQDVNGQIVKLANVSATADIEESGVNGLDTGSEQTATWYYIWGIYNGSTFATLLSAEADIDDITFPSGYTYGLRLGAIYNGAGGDLVTMYQLGPRAYTGYNNGNMINGANNENYTNVNLSGGLVPPIARFVVFEMALSTSSGTHMGQGIVAPDGTGTTDTHGRPCNIRIDEVGSTQQGAGGFICPILTPQQVKFRKTGTNIQVHATRTGWIL